MTYCTSLVVNMSRIDLKTNQSALSTVHSEICDPNSKNNWVIFGYEGKTNVLKVVEKGDGGIEELVDEVNSGRIQYIWIRVTDPNTALHKFVLVNWQGEGVQEIRKGNCASHFRDVESFFRGAHLKIHARSEDDLDEEEIIDKVAKSSGSNYSFHKEKAQPIEEPKPVGSVYQKTRPHQEININKRDDFWEKTQQEERQRRETDQKSKAAVNAKLDQERRDRESSEASQRERREAERMKGITQQRILEKRVDQENKEAIKEQWEQQQMDAIREEEARKKRSDQMRKQRSAEVSNLVSQRSENPKHRFENQYGDDDTPTSRHAPIELPTSDPGNKPELVSQRSVSDQQHPTSVPRNKNIGKLSGNRFPQERDNHTSSSRSQPIQLPTSDPGNAAERESEPSHSERQAASRYKPPSVGKLAANRFQMSQDEDSPAPRRAPIKLPTEDPGNAAELESEPTQTEEEYVEQEQEYRAPPRPNKLPPNRVAVMPTSKPEPDEDYEREQEEQRYEEERRQEEIRQEDIRRQEQIREDRMRQEAARREEQLRQEEEEQRRQAQPPTSAHSAMRQGLPPRQPDSDEEQEEEDDTWGVRLRTKAESINLSHPRWFSPPMDDAPSVPQAVVTSYTPEQDQEELYDDANVVGGGGGGGGGGDTDVRARALYDYQAGDDTEITFDPDDIITNIEQIDPGWWTGTAPDGTHGMFPANYVELL